MRAVLDVNVLVSGALSADGAAAEILRRTRDGEFELVVSELLLAELAHTLAYPKISRRLSGEQAVAYISWLRAHATLVEDPAEPAPVSSPDPDDDYLITLASHERTFLVSGDKHLLGFREAFPILAPAEFLTRLRELP